MHRPDAPPAAFLVCHSYEIAVQHFALRPHAPSGRPQVRDLPGLPHRPRDARQAFLAPFDDRLFIWEHRHWQAVEMDAQRVAEQGGALLATESRPGESRQGRRAARLPVRPRPGRHPVPPRGRPGRRPGLDRPPRACLGASGRLRALPLRPDDADPRPTPTRLARTFALLIPGWLTDRFNRLAAARGLHPIPPPVQSMEEFEERALAS